MRTRVSGMADLFSSQEYFEDEVNLDPQQDDQNHKLPTDLLERQDGSSDRACQGKDADRKLYSRGELFCCHLESELQHNSILAGIVQRDASRTWQKMLEKLQDGVKMGYPHFSVFSPPERKNIHPILIESGGWIFTRSNCVECQEGNTGCQDVLVRMIAFKIVNNLRIQATIATFFCLPALSRRSYMALMIGLKRVAAMVAM
jgi:hypothetical protein